MSAPNPNTVKLVVNSQEYGGWKSVRISAGIERQARDFNLEVTDKWPGQTDIPRRIQPGDACQVFIGDDLVMTGYVDATPIRYDGKSVGVGVKGRSKTADLVDCCPAGQGAALVDSWADVKAKPDSKAGKVIKPPTNSANQWRNVKMETIAAALAAPYGVRVIAEANTGKAIPDHQINPGETVFESIDRMMRQRHVLSTDNEKGDLVFIDIGSGGRTTTAIELGKNVLAADAPLDYKDVFSEYIVKGQMIGSDDPAAANAAESQGTATGDTASVKDTLAKRRRVLVLKQSGQADDGSCKDRAEYERAHRAAKALQTNYTLLGWRQEDGRLWLPNMIVPVRDDLVGFNADMVIAEVSWILANDGMRTEVRVGPPDGYRTKATNQVSKNWSDVK